MKKALSFNDVLLAPKRSDIESRRGVDIGEYIQTLFSNLTNEKLYLKLYNSISYNCV